ncbi:hypothetical protein ACFW6X_26575 [Streptomyces bacillaris]|uniref:hypothetical protein n=1 Tax=Streptomyces bacillaris TaxID=68179 RepID=UPI00100828F8
MTHTKRMLAAASLALAALSFTGTAQAAESGPLPVVGESGISASGDDHGTFFDGKEAKIEKIFEINSKELKKAEKYIDYLMAVQSDA